MFNLNNKKLDTIEWHSIVYCSMSSLCTSKKTINVKTAHFPLELSGVVKRHLKIRTGFYFVITVSDISNIWIVGDLKQDFKTSMVSDGADQTQQH